jgi:hypothetical protein
MIFSFDFESWLIEPARQLPPGVCMSWCEIVESAAGLAVGRSGVIAKHHAVDALLRWLESGATLVGANTAFDALVSVVTCATLGGDWKRLLRAFVDAYESGRVRDVFVRQKLLDLAAGCYRFEELPNGAWITHGYNLRDLSRRLTKRQLSKPEEGDTSHWRLRFGELDDVPIENYPKAAYDYALEDAIATAEDYIVQEQWRTGNARIRRNFPGRDPFVDEIRQTMACVPLKTMSAYGLRTDGPSVERFAAEVQEKIVEARADLVDAGLVRQPSYHRNTDAIVAYLEANERLAWFWEGDEIKLSKARYTEAWRATEDVNLWRLANYREISKDPKAYAAHMAGLVDAGLVDIDHTRDTKRAAERCANAYIGLGLAVPRTDGWAKKTDDEKKAEPYDCVSLDSDACAGSEDPILQVYSSYTSLAKTLANDIPMLRSGVTLPVHTRYEELLETGRTSSSKPNVQNVRRLPGIRECFVPRPGHVFVDCDFGSLELHTLAQTCMWVLGFSKMAEALNAGRDLHLTMAANMLGIDYDTAKARKQAGDSQLDDARTCGKCCNFGRPGGLGIDTFVVFGWTNYRVRLTREKAKELLELYDETWVEMPAYFNWVKSHKDPFSVKTVIDEKTKQEKETCRYNMIQPWSGRLRAGASFCAACNTPFQGLGADVAKFALWLVWKATMGLSELGESDPLFGCAPVNFVHDSIMTEVPEARAHAAAVRQKELMDLAGRIVLPDVPVKADMLVCRQWSKKAQRLKNAAGELIPWDLRTACREALEGWAAGHAPEGRDAGFDYLQFKQWPSDVAREAVLEYFGGENVVGKVAA